MNQSRFIRFALSSALQLWLRALMTRTEALQITIDAGDRQLLGGRIPKISLQAEQVIYQGLHISKLALQATGIHVNLGQILRGRPIQLTEPVLAQLQAFVSVRDLNQSLPSDLLSTALTQVTQQLLPDRQTFQVRHIDLAPGQIAFQGRWIDGDRPPGTAQLLAQLTAQASAIHAHAIEVVTLSGEPSGPNSDSLPAKANPQRRSLPDQSFALGNATIQQLTITADAITVEAWIKILP